MRQVSSHFLQRIKISIIPSFIFCNVIFYQSPDLIKWARRNGAKWLPWHGQYLARRKDLQMLQWASENGCEINVSTVSEAISQDWLEGLDWLYSEGHDQVCFHTRGKKCECMMRCIARMGNVEMMKWARKNEYRWDHHTCDSAVYYGHLKMMQFLRENGCPWDRKNCFRLAKNNHYDEIESWIMSQDD